MRSVRFLANAALAVLLLVSQLVPVARAADPFPASIALPNGWRPEGIAAGRGPVIYAGSLANGAIYAVDPRTGVGEVLVSGEPDRVAVGLEFDARTNLLYVAGGPTGKAFVYDAGTGNTAGSFVLLASTPTFVNDVVVTRDAAYFTDSLQPVLYRMTLGAEGPLPDAGGVQTIALSGDYTHVAGLNLNGIVATPDGRTLIAVHSTLGVLYAIDAGTGVATAIDVGGAALTFGDGLLLQGHTLYVVRNRLNEVVVVELAHDWRSGSVADVRTSAAFDVPATIASYAGRLWVVNARFTTPPTPDTAYSIVQVPR
jgi:outer membrane protein assembly factor BamB